MEAKRVMTIGDVRAFLDVNQLRTDLEQEEMEVDTNDSTAYRF